MKKIQYLTIITLLSLVLFLHIVQGTLLLSINNIESNINISSKKNNIPALNKDSFYLDSYTLQQSDAFSSKSNRNNPRNSIQEILNPQNLYFPGYQVHIRNRFNTTEYPSFAVVDHNVSIYLHKQGYTPLDDLNHLVGYKKTNGTPDGAAPLSSNIQNGWIDFNYTIDDVSTLISKFGISPGDNVTLYQLLDPSNTPLIEGLEKIEVFDNFTISGFAAVVSLLGFQNPWSGDNVFRQGENATALIDLKSGSTPIENRIISGKLFDSSNTEILNNTNGISYYFHDVSTENPRITTDLNGQLNLIVTTTYGITPEDDYYFNISADLTGTEYLGHTNKPEAFSTSDYNFTVQNEQDLVELQLISATPQPLDPPNKNITLVIFRVRAQYAYNPSSYYYPANMPVNASLNNYPNGVTLKVANGYSNNGSKYWYQTDTNGYIGFNITAEFPTLYLDDIIQDITGFVNLQNNNAPIYPYHTSPSPQPHRFMSSITGVNASYTEAISINPDFWIGNVILNSLNTTTIRPGEAVNLTFAVNSTQAPGVKFSGVPVNISLSQPIAGVSLIFSAKNPVYNTTFRYTDNNGIIEVIIATTYLTTPELLKTVVLNITADFEHDSQIRWIGTENRGTSTLAEFNQTWRKVQSSVVTINPRFNIHQIIFSTTNETGDTTIRSGDSITVRFLVRSTSSGSPLPNVPINVSLYPSYSNYSGKGISLSYKTTGGVYGPDPDYHYNTLQGWIEVAVITTYGVTPKNIVIQLNATANFALDSNSVWFIGEKSSRADFKSNSSYSDVLQTITVASQYFKGNIYLPNPATNPNSTLIQQSETLQIEFKLSLSYTGGGPIIFPSINGVNITLFINGSNPSIYNMNIIPARSQKSSASSVIFIIQTNVSGITPEASYYISARADFGAAQSLTYNLTHTTVPSGKLSGVWVNGSTTNLYSILNQAFKVKNIDRIKLQIESITDLIHPDAGYNSTSGFYEVYRGSTTISINGTYMDNTGQPVPGHTVIIAYNYTGGPNPITLTSVITNGQGLLFTSFTLGLSLPLTDIIIYGRDQIPPIPQEAREGINNVRLVTTVRFQGHSRSGSFRGSAAYVGEFIYTAGTLIDDQNVPITSPELSGRLRLVGWNGTHEIGTPITGSPGGGGLYNLTYQVPLNYAQNTLIIRFNITSSLSLLHFRVNYTEFIVNIYTDFQIITLEIFFPFNSSTIGLNNGSTYKIIGVENRNFYISGIIQDLDGEPLDNKLINDSWANNDQIRSLNALGRFNNFYSLPGWNNGTWNWLLYHIIDNGSYLPTFYTVTFQWEVYDTTSPWIIPGTPSTSQLFGVLPNNDITIVTINVYDPNNAQGYVTVGLNPSTVTIWIDDVPSAMVNMGGGNFSFSWDTSGALDTYYNLTFSATDYAGNRNQTTFIVVIDIVLPTATINFNENPEGYVIVNQNGNVVITGTINDLNSITSRNSGIDNTAVRILFYDNNDILVTNESATVFTGSFGYDWNIIINPNDLDLITRNQTFLTLSENWNITLVFKDLAGNRNTIGTNTKLDNDPPLMTIANSADWPSKIDDQLVVNVTFHDLTDGILKSGIRSNSLTLELVVNSTGRVQRTFRDGSPGVNITRRIGGAIFDLDLSTIDEDLYFIRVKILDNTGNEGTVISSLFVIDHPSIGDVTIDLIAFIIFDILALGAGVIIAVLFERYKTMKMK